MSKGPKSKKKSPSSSDESTSESESESSEMEEKMQKLSIKSEPVKKVKVSMVDILKEAKNPSPYVKNASFQELADLRTSVPRANILLPLNLSVESTTTVTKQLPPGKIRMPVSPESKYVKTPSKLKVSGQIEWKIEDFEDIVDLDLLVVGRSNAAAGEQGYSIDKLKEIIRAINTRIGSSAPKIRPTENKKVSYVNAIREFFGMPLIEEENMVKAKRKKI